MTFVLPFLVFMLVTSLEPRPAPADSARSEQWIAYEHYPLVYAVKIGLTLGAMLLVLPGYRQFPLKMSVWAIPVGVAGIFVWVGLCHLGWEQPVFSALGLTAWLESGARSAYNPFEQLRHAPGAYLWAYLALRGLGLVAVVPIVEEFFLRGLLMRLPIDAQWWTVPVGRLSGMALLLGTLYPALTHPAEMFAAVVWFSLVTLLVWKTRNIWDAVVAHAVTNLLLGAYVVATGQWHFV